MLALEWTQIVCVAKNFVTYGVPFPTRQQRKELKVKQQDKENVPKLLFEKPLPKKQQSAKGVRKDIGTSATILSVAKQNLYSHLEDSDSSSSNLSPPSKKKKEPFHVKIKYNEHSLRSNKMKEQITKKLKQKEVSLPSDDLSLSSDEEVGSKKDKIKKKKNLKYPKHVVSSDENIICDSDGSSQSWDFAAENKLLKQKIKMYKKKLDVYKTMNSIVKEFYKLPAEIKRMQQRCNEINTVLSDSSSISFPKSKDSTSSSAAIKSVTDYPSSQKSIFKCSSPISNDEHNSDNSSIEKHNRYFEDICDHNLDSSNPELKNDLHFVPEVKHEINVPRAKAPPTFTQEPLAGPSKMDNSLPWYLHLKRWRYQPSKEAERMLITQHLRNNLLMKTSFKV